MDFLTFKERMYPMGCFSINQVLLWETDFDRNNLTRWCQKGLLVKLRNQYYAFPEFHVMWPTASMPHHMSVCTAHCRSTG